MNIVKFENGKISENLVKFGTVEDIVIATAEAFTAGKTEALKQAGIFVDQHFTGVISNITDELITERGLEFATSYIAKAKPIVKDMIGTLSNKQKSLLALVAPEVTDAAIVDDERVIKLEEEKKALEAKAHDQYTDAVANEAVLKSDLERLNQVVKKLQDGDDVASARKEAEDLRQKLGDANSRAASVGTLKNELSAKRDEINEMDKLANGLRMQISTANDNVKAERAKLEKMRGEQILTKQEAMELEAMARVEAAKKLKESFTLNDFVLQNGMVQEEIDKARAVPSRKEYNTDDVEEIANIIYSGNNDSDIVKDIKALIYTAYERAEGAKLKARYESLEYSYRDTIKAMITEG